MHWLLEDADPLLFTGEMMYPWMFREIAALTPFAEAGEHILGRLMDLAAGRC